MGDSLLDDTLADIAEGEVRDARFWVQRIANRGPAMREEVLSRLVASGVLEARDDRFLWVFRSRRYPAIDGEPEREVKLRIMDVIFGSGIPAPRDVVIINLAHACGIFEQLLSGAEMERLHERIEQVRKLDLIGQAMSEAISTIERSIASSISPDMYWVGADSRPGHARSDGPVGRGSETFQHLGRVCHDFTQPFRQAVLRGFKVVLALQPHPEASGVPEEAREQQSGLRRDSPLSMDYGVNPAHIHANSLGKAVLGDAHWLEKLLIEDLPRMYWRQLLLIA